MRDLATFLVWLLCIILIGWSALSLVLKKKMLSFTEALALSYGIGIGLLTIEMALLSVLNIKFSAFSLMVLWVPLVIWRLLRPFGGEGSPACRQAGNDDSRRSFSVLEKFFIFGISFEVLYAFFRTLIKPMESYDAIAIYALKAKIFYLAKIIPHNFFSTFKDFVPHIEYPLLIPLAETSFYIFCGSLNDLLVKVVFPLYYVALLIILYFILRRFLDRKPSMFFTFLLATIPQLTDFATNGYADMPFAFYCSISFFYLFLWIRKKEPPFLIISFIFSALSIWTKAEGLMFAFINAAIAILSMVREKSFNMKTITYAGASLIIITIYIMLQHSMGLAVNTDFSASQVSIPEMFIVSLKRMPPILYEYQIQFFGPKKWNIIWVLFIIGFIVGFRKIFTKNMMPVTTAILLIFLGYSGVYMFSTAPQGFGWHLSTSGSRLFLHFVPIVVLWLALLFDQLKLEI